MNLRRSAGIVTTSVLLMLLLSGQSVAQGKWVQCTKDDGTPIGDWFHVAGSVKLSQICNATATPTPVLKMPSHVEHHYSQRAPLYEGMSPSDAQATALAFLREGCTSFNDPTFRDMPNAWQMVLTK